MTDVDIRGCRLSFDVIENSGSPSGATPIVWTHGLSSSRADDAEMPLVDLERLAADRPVLRYDARGHGLSGDLTDPSEGAWAEMALDLIGLVDHAGYDRVVLAGASMGTTTSLHATRHLGARVEKLLLVIPPTGWETRSGSDRCVSADGRHSRSQGHRTPDRRNGRRGAARPVRRRRRVADQALDRPASGCARTTRRGLPRCRPSADLPDPEALRTIEAPALVLAWSGDPGHPVSTAERLGELLPHANVVISSTAAELATWTARTAVFLAE